MASYTKTISYAGETISISVTLDTGETDVSGVNEPTYTIDGHATGIDASASVANVPYKNLADRILKMQKAMQNALDGQEVSGKGVQLLLSMGFAEDDGGID